MKADLKRCPFCNSHKLTLDTTEHISWVRCFDCGACGPSTIHSVAFAVRLWNDGYPGSTAMVNCHPTNRSDLKTIEL